MAEHNIILIKIIVVMDSMITTGMPILLHTMTYANFLITDKVFPKLNLVAQFLA